MDIVDPEEGGRKLFRNVGNYMPIYTVARPTKPMLEPKISQICLYLMTPEYSPLSEQKWRLRPLLSNNPQNYYYFIIIIIIII
jgi:hypothetical protein